MGLKMTVTLEDENGSKITVDSDHVNIGFEFLLETGEKMNFETVDVPLLSYSFGYHHKLLLRFSERR